MKKLITRTFLFAGILSLTLFSSCVNLAKRFKGHKTIWIGKENTDKYVAVQAETYNITEPAKSPSTPKDLFSLTPEGQAELIKALSIKVVSSPEDFISSLTKKLSAEDNTSTKVKVFPTTITKSIVFSVDRKWASVGYQTNRRLLNRIGDRLSNLEVSVNIPAGSQIQYNSWDKFVTNWVTVDLGKVTSSQQWSATANLSATIAGKTTGADKSTSSNTAGTKTGKADISQTENTTTNVLGNETNKGTEASTSSGTSGSLNFTDKYETSLNLLLSRMKLSGALSKEKMTLRQEGAFGIDLSGNTSVSVDLTFKGEYASPIFVYKIAKFYDNNVAITIANLVKNKTMWIFPNVTDTTTAKLQYKYLYRHVRKWSKKHIPDARQRVKNYYGEVGHGVPSESSYVRPIDVDLIKPEDFKPVTFRIGTGIADTYLNWDDEVINFETSNDAANFLEYLITISKTTHNYGTIKDIPTNNKLSGFRVIKVQN